MLLTLRHELRSRQAVLLACAVAGAFSAAGCGDGPTEPGEPGTIRVTLSTTGGDPDHSGYLLIIADRRVTTTSNGLVTVTGISPGTYALRLDDVEHNCDVIDGNPRQVTVAAGATLDVSLSISCETTGIEVIVTSSGEDIPDRFDVLVNGFPAGKVSAQGSTLFSYLAPGDYGVTLNLPGSCVDQGSTSVNVASRAVITVEFTVTCSRAELIAFTAWGNGPMVSLIDSRGGAGRVLTRGAEPSWSPDGRRIAISSLECYGGGWYYYYGDCEGGIEIVDVSTGTRIPFQKGALGRAPAWAPTGDLIAFDRVDVQGNASALLYLLRPDGSVADSLGFPGVSFVAHPTWSPDGQRIAFVCAFASSSSSGPAFSYGICVADREGLGFARLTESTVFVSDAAWSPGGNHIAFSTSTGITLLDVSTREVTSLTSGQGPAWSPEGTRLAFERGNGLYIINSDGSGLQRISTGTHRDPAWRP